MSVFYDHIALAVTELERSTDFYRDILGLEYSSTRRLSDGRHQTVFHIGEEILVLFRHEDGRYEEKIRKPRSGIHHLAFRMDAPSYDAVIDRCKANGVTLRRQEVNSGALGEGYATYFYDPDGNEIEIKKYEDDPKFKEHTDPEYHV